MSDSDRIVADQSRHVVFASIDACAGSIGAPPNRCSVTPFEGVRGDTSYSTLNAIRWSRSRWMPHPSL